MAGAAGPPPAFERALSHGSVELSGAADGVPPTTAALGGAPARWGKTAIAGPPPGPSGRGEHASRCCCWAVRVDANPGPSALAIGVALTTVNVAKGLGEGAAPGKAPRAWGLRFDGEPGGAPRLAAGDLVMVILGPSQGDGENSPEEDETSEGVGVRFVLNGRDLPCGAQQGLPATGQALHLAVSFWEPGQRVTLLETGLAGMPLGDEERSAMKDLLAEVTRRAGSIAAEASTSKAAIAAGFRELRQVIVDKQHGAARRCAGLQEAMERPLQLQALQLEALLGAVGAGASQTPYVAAPASSGSFASTFATTCPQEELALVPREELKRLRERSAACAKLEKEVQKLSKKVEKLKEKNEAQKAVNKRANPLAPLDLVELPGGAAAAEAAEPERADHRSKFAAHYLALASAKRPTVHKCVPAFEGWVEQGSPCCAAAAVAGAWNALLPQWERVRQRMDPDAFSPDSAAPALSQHDVLEVYRGLWGQDLQVAEEALRDLLHQPADFDLQSLYEAVADKLGGFPQDSKPKTEGMKGILASIAAAPPDDPESAGAALHHFSERLDDLGPVATKLKTCWVKMGSIAKLSGQKPSTAPVGNDRLIAALKRLAETHEVPLKVWRFMGCGKSRFVWKVAEGDSTELVTQQWEGLVKEVAGDAILIFHLENHYSMIYAAREWEADAGYGGKRTVRQVLVAKPGQQPCSWIDFETMRRTLLTWNGHTVVGVAVDSAEEVLVL